MSSWLKDKGSTIGAVAAAAAAFVAILQLFVVNPMNQRFDDLERNMDQRFDAQDRYINQRFDAQDKHINQRFNAQDQRLDQLANEVSELRKLVVGISERVSRNEGQIEVIREQSQIADAP